MTEKTQKRVAVVAFAGTGECFAVNAGSFLSILLSLLALDKAKLLQPARDHGATLIRGAGDALRYLRGSEVWPLKPSALQNGSSYTTSVLVSGPATALR